VNATALADSTWALSLPLSDVVADYLEALRAAGRSPRTIEWYQVFLLEFIRFEGRAGAPAKLADLAPPAVRRWVVALKSRSPEPAPASLAGRVRTLKAFGTWVASEYELEPHPLRGLKVPKVPDVLVRSLRDADILQLIAAIHRHSHFPDRDLAVVLLMLDTGLRVSETASVMVRDVDLEAGRCRVMGKGSKERVVPIGRNARRAIRRYLVVGRRLGQLDAPLFERRGGGPLSVVGLQHLIQRVVARSSLSVRCSPHVLRHTFARSFLANGGDVFSLQRILGHSPNSLAVTRRYVQLLDDDLRETHRRASPVDNLSAARMRAIQGSAGLANENRHG
jgi:site-specific recombinase XerD